jgi:hypothetical protein
LLEWVFFRNNVVTPQPNQEWSRRFYLVGGFAMRPVSLFLPKQRKKSEPKPHGTPKYRSEHRRYRPHFPAYWHETANERSNERDM